jgi:hypothetical protein
MKQFLLLNTWCFCLYFLGYVACNKEENILTWERFMRPRISFGVTMERMLGGEESSDMV